jgi:hypothetical protein
VPGHDSCGRPSLRLRRSVTTITRSLALNLFVFQASYPKVKIVKTTCVRGGTGCWWKQVEHPAANDYRARLIALAGELNTGLVDMTDAWTRYVRSTGKDLSWFKRDEVHANERGEQVIGRILAAHLAPPLPGK